MCIFESILLIGREKGSGKLYYRKPHLVYMQCSYAMLINAERQHDTAVQTYNIATGTVCTDSTSVHADYVFCGTIVVSCVDFELWSVAKLRCLFEY